MGVLERACGLANSAFVAVASVVLVEAVVVGGDLVGIALRRAPGGGSMALVVPSVHPSPSASVVDSVVAAHWTVFPSPPVLLSWMSAVDLVGRVGAHGRVCVSSSSGLGLKMSVCFVCSSCCYCAFR